jgi:HEAT repeat protein
MEQDEIRQWVTALGHPDSEVRLEARRQLASAGTAALDALAEVLRSPLPAVSYAATCLLAEMDHPRHFELMVEALASPNMLAAEVAAGALRRYGERAVEPLLDELPHCTPVVQVSIVHTLEMLGSRKAVKPLMELLASTSYDTLRYTIIQALGTIGDPAAADLVRQYQDDANHHIRERARWALEQLGAVSETGNMPPPTKVTGEKQEVRFARPSD